MNEQELKKKAKAVLGQMPEGGLFKGLGWKIAVEPFVLEKVIVEKLQKLGRVLLQFYRAINLLYRQSVEGKQPMWVAKLFDAGKPKSLIDLQRSEIFKNEIPRVIRPDILLTDSGMVLTELDSVPGGIGVSAFLNKTYSQFETNGNSIIGGKQGMLTGFASIFGDAPRVWIVVSEESSTYRPEMVWLAQELGSARFKVEDTKFSGFSKCDAVYRFFELFDLDNIANANLIIKLALGRQITVTPPFKYVFEEKLNLGLLWNRNLQDFWKIELGGAFFDIMREIVPYTWIVDPTPLPPQGAIPRLEITDWQQLKKFSQKQRNLILKISGFSPLGWGARSVVLGSDLPQSEWASAVDVAINSFNSNPYILQEYHKPRAIDFSGYDPLNDAIFEIKGRVRLCPYYFVQGENENARATLCGVLATICPADKKIIHGMRDAILAPCAENVGQEQGGHAK